MSYYEENRGNKDDGTPRPTKQLWRIAPLDASSLAIATDGVSPLPTASMRLLNRLVDGVKTEFQPLYPDELPCYSMHLKTRTIEVVPVDLSTVTGFRGLSTRTRRKKYCSTIVGSSPRFFTAQGTCLSDKREVLYPRKMKTYVSRSWKRS